SSITNDAHAPLELSGLERGRCGDRRHRPHRAGKAGGGARAAAHPGGGARHLWPSHRRRDDPRLGAVPWGLHHRLASGDWRMSGVTLWLLIGVAAGFVLIVANRLVAPLVRGWRTDRPSIEWLPDADPRNLTARLLDNCLALAF